VTELEHTPPRNGSDPLGLLRWYDRSTYFVRVFSWRIFVCSLGLHGLCLLPIILANRPSADDWVRLTDGHLWWSGAGRPLTDLVMNLADLGAPLADAFPLFQLLAIAVLATMTALVAARFRLIGIWAASMITLSLGANPFFLANLSFRFDAFPMALSIALAILPIVIVQKEDESLVPWDVGFGSVCLILSLACYQASLGVFLVFTFLECVLGTLRSLALRAVAVNLLARAITVAIALAVYKVIATVTIGGYGYEHSVVVNPLTDLGFVISQLRFYGTDCIRLLNARLQLPLLLPVVAAPILGIAHQLRQRHCMRHWWLRLLVSVVCCAGMAVAAFVFLAILKSPTGGVRTYIGAGALITGSLIVLNEVIGNTRPAQIAKVTLLSLPTYTIVVFAAIYGNCLTGQKEYEAQIARRLAHDLNQLSQSMPARHFVFSGSPGFAPWLVHVINHRYPLLRRLVNVDLAGPFVTQMLRYYGLFESHSSTQIDDDANGAAMPANRQTPVVVEPDFAIYQAGDTLFVRFTKRGP
jgi:hypothetical protein